MEPSLLHRPTPRFTVEEDHEYTLVVSPASDVRALVEEEIQQFYHTYKHKATPYTQPHIVMARFFARQAMEETIIRYMHRITAVQNSFAIMLNNFSGNPFNNIFIRVQEHEPFRKIFDALAPVDQYIQRCGYPAVTRVDRPHINVAKKLQAQVYNKAVFHYAQKSFHASFMVNELVLLKRRSHFDEFVKVNVFALAGNN